MSRGKPNKIVVCAYAMSEQPPADGMCGHDEVVLYADEDEGWLDCLEQFGATEVRPGVPGPGLWVWTGRCVTHRTDTMDGTDFDTEFEESEEPRRLTLEELQAVAEGRNPLAPRRRAENAAYRIAEKLRAALEDEFRAWLSRGPRCTTDEPCPACKRNDGSLCYMSSAAADCECGHPLSRHLAPGSECVEMVGSMSCECTRYRKK